MKLLCCGKGDRNDEEDHPPRPARVPDKVPPVKAANSSVKTTVAEEKPENPDLWKEAFDRSDSRKIHRVAEGGLKGKRKNGDDINIRDGAEKILNAALQARDLIAKIVAFDPTGKASAAWADVSLGLTMVSTNIERRDAMFASSEYLAENLAYYALVDTHYRNRKVDGGQNFDRALVQVYTAILDYTAEATKVQQKNTFGRIVRSVKGIDEQHLTQLKATIESQHLDANKWVDFVNTLRDRARAQKILDDVDEILALSKKVYSKILNDEENTGTWLLDSQEYKDWKAFPGSVLWLHGVVGCGKSVLCSTVIKDIEELCKKDSSKSLGYWYFEGTQHDSQSDVVSDIQSDFFVVLDALDEYPMNGKERPHLFSLLIDLSEAHKKNIHILATGRPEQDIKRAMEHFPSINLEEKLAKDVETFVHAALEEEELRDTGKDIKFDIVDALLNNGERRF
ncbi:uncharacterized protein N7483_009832 [Penicillium malachiteum]|uniref:uncharacterized protein n=1 Tax=Penicillium malachiteum TaxID=1324776 RepID=UPI0025478872|nr:uncharacterized protein N7483_009832 [Penicillium malachiteum]KAJ5721898.1 hypothetical protein N7483_009832 [Penicillium malachiteum]